MYELKEDVDLSFLSGCELVQVCIGRYQLTFNFNKNVSISIESEFRYLDNQNEWKWQPEDPGNLVASRTVALLGAKVERVERGPSNSLHLFFSNGPQLLILAPSQEFECYQISRPGQTIVI